MKLFLNIHGKKYPFGSLTDNGQGYIFRYEQAFLSSPLKFLYSNSFPLNTDDHNIEYGNLKGFLWDYVPNGFNFLLCQNICRDIHIPTHNFINLLHNNSSGALESDKYFFSVSGKEEKVDLGNIAKNITNMYEDRPFNKGLLYKLNCSLNGNTPKICVIYENNNFYIAESERSNKQWIIKVPWETGNKYYGVGEYLFSELAALCGINVPEHKLFTGNNGLRYFAAKRFDRSIKGKELTISLCALINKFFRFGIEGIEDTFKLIRTKITDEAEIFKIFELICFYIKIGNEDLSTLNITFIYDMETNKLKLAPAYDLSPFRGTNILPNNLDWEDNIKTNIALLEVGTRAGINPQKIKAGIIKTDNVLKTYPQMRQKLLAAD